MAPETKIKKVKAYPIQAQLKDAKGSFPGQIMKLTLNGLMIEVAGTSVQPGDRVEISFVTPVLHGVVGLVGVVVKVYNQLTGGSQPPPTPGTSVGSIHLIEVHYKMVPPESMGRIAEYLESTGQAKRG